MNDTKEILSRMEAGGNVTREEAEFVVREVQRVCKGPVKPGKLVEYTELRNAAGAFGGSNTGNSIALLDSLNRDYCGYDFNEVICKLPFNGAEYVVNCPKCKLEISFRTPKFPIV